jgi:adenylate cyclase class IV
MDQTEGIRRLLVSEINGDVETDDPLLERNRLEFEHGQVWDTSEMTSAFEAIGFMAPFVMVKRRSDGVKGCLMFQHHPRFYFSFIPDQKFS